LGPFHYDHWLILLIFAQIRLVINYKAYIPHFLHYNLDFLNHRG
jgi:hypothetical protein